MAGGALLGGGGHAALEPNGGGRFGDGVPGLLRAVVFGEGTLCTGIALLCGGGGGGPLRKLSELFTACPLLPPPPTLSLSKLGLFVCDGG